MRQLLFSIILFSTTLSINGQLEKFIIPASIDDIGTVYQYKKSNWDGSHASSVFVYVADSNHLESLKWWEGDEVATLVTADIDWKTFSVREFQNHKLRKGITPELIAILKMEPGNKFRIKVGEMNDSMSISAFPWQSYDFDFAGLSFIWRGLINKQSSFWFHVADAGMQNGQMAFINKGSVDVKFIGKEKIGENVCLKYEANGPGLENKGGYIWIDTQSYIVRKYKIEIPDESEYENGMLELVKTYKMDREAWKHFIKKCIGEN